MTIVSLNPADIDPSFIPDRMPASEEADAGLVEAIREQGQQVPILVRPHPEFQGRYQVAFGHRRLRAVSSLGIPVKAVVRDLSDEQLVVAQGQENNERRDLTYIEKARFAQKLQMRFPRDTIMAAMSLHKGDLSNMLSVVGRIPEDLIDLIGPAPSVGRRNWMDLADQLSSSQVKEAARAYVKDASVAALPSEERFKSLLDFLKPKAQAKKPASGHRKPATVWQKWSKATASWISRSTRTKHRNLPISFWNIFRRCLPNTGPSSDL